MDKKSFGFLLIPIILFFILVAIVMYVNVLPHFENRTAVLEQVDYYRFR